MPTIWGGMDNNPGKPTWGPYLDHSAALKQQTLLDRRDPLGALAWDRRADARQAFWDASVFAPALNRAFAIKYNYPTPASEDPVVPLD